MSKEFVSDPIRYSDWNALVGFMTEQDALKYVHSTPVQSLTSDDEWLAKIRTAREYVAAIPDRTNTKPEITPLHANYNDHLAQLKMVISFQETVAGYSSYRFGSIELSKLRCLQAHINLDYLAQMTRRVPESGNDLATLEFCLPLSDDSERMEVLSSATAGTNSLFLVSPNPNFRIVGMANGQDPANGRKFTAIFYGFGSPQLKVAEYKGAHIIMNGHHRALSLLKKGHKSAPCLIVTAENFPYPGPPTPELLLPDRIMSERPAFLGDFESKAAIIVPRRRQRIVINVHAEAQSVPF